MMIINNNLVFFKFLYDINFMVCRRIIHSRYYDYIEVYRVNCHNCKLIYTAVIQL